MAIHILQCTYALQTLATKSSYLYGQKKYQEKLETYCYKQETNGNLVYIVKK